MIVAAIFAPLIAPHPPDAQDINAVNAGPSPSHWLGTDDLGRDILSRLIWGARISLRAAFEIVGLAAVVAIPLGLIAGFFRGAVDSVIMRTMDALFSFPPLILALTVAALLGADINDAAIAIAIVFVPSFVRLLRGEVIAVREEAYIESARSLGATSKRLIGRHVLPNVASPIIIQLALALGFALLTEAGLSFLGIGEQPPTPSWGGMLQEGFQFINSAPWAVIFPGLAIMLTVLAFNLVADGLRDSLGRERPPGSGLVGGEREHRRAMAAARLGRRRQGDPSADDRPRQPDAALLEVDRACGSSSSPGRNGSRSWRTPTSPCTGGRRWASSVRAARARPSRRWRSWVCCRPRSPGWRARSGSRGRSSPASSPAGLRKLRGNDIAMIFQEPMTSLNPAFTVGNQIAEQVRTHRELSRADAWKVAVEMLDRVEIPQAAVTGRGLPARLLGRDAPARHDRHGPVVLTQAADRRRAHHGARRDDAGADHRTAALAPARRGHGDDLRHPRSRGDRRRGRRRGA